MPPTRRAFIELYTAYRDRIFTFFWYRVAFDQAVAEDLTSAVFLKAFEHYARYDPARPFASWLYAIAWNHLKNHYRRGGREVGLEQAATLPCPRSGAAVDRAEVNRLIAAINCLDGYSRDVLLCRYVDGLSHRETAELLDRSEEAVRAQASRALRALRQQLGSDTGDTTDSPETYGS